MHAIYFHRDFLEQLIYNNRSKRFLNDQKQVIIYKYSKLVTNLKLEFSRFSEIYVKSTVK